MAMEECADVARCGAAGMNLAMTAAEQSLAPWRELLPARDGDIIWSWPLLMLIALRKRVRAIFASGAPVQIRASLSRCSSVTGTC